MSKTLANYARALNDTLGKKSFFVALFLIIASGFILNEIGLGYNWAIIISIIILLCAGLLWCFEHVKQQNEQIDPQIEIEFEPKSPYLITDPESEGKGNRILRIGVRNKGLKNLDNCLAILEKLTDRNGKEGFFTPIGLLTHHQYLQLRTGGVFRLRGRQHKYVLVAQLNEKEECAEFELFYETLTNNKEEVKKRYPNTIKKELSPYNLTITVYGASTPKTINLKLYVGSDGYLSAEPVTAS